MTTITLDWGRGYAGRSGERPWVARITGIDVKMGLDREFCDAASVAKEHFGRARTMIHLTYELDPGLYECQARGERWCLVVTERRASRVSPARARRIAELLDAGLAFEGARIESRREMFWAAAAAQLRA